MRAKKIFERTMSRVPEKHRVTYERARAAVAAGEPFAKHERPHGFATFEQAVAAIAKREHCTRTEAMTRARRERPEAFDIYQREGRERVAKAADDAAKARQVPEAAANWRMIVSEIMTRDNVPRSVAMQRARAENPSAYEAYQRA